MIREPNKNDLTSIKKDIEENNGAVGYIKMIDGASPEETVKQLVESEREFLGDSFIFDVDDLCYEFDPEVKDGLIIKMKPHIYEKIMGLINNN